MNLTFEPAEHIYKLDGVIIPSVTQILSPISKVIYEEISMQVLMAKAHLGSKVHKLIERYLKYNFAQPDEITKPYFEQFILFWDELKSNHQVNLIQTEFKGFYKDDKLTYGGTIDFIVEIDKEIWLIDWKTVVNPVDLLLSLQLFGYTQIATQQLNIKIDRVGAVQVNKESYNFIDLSSSILKPKIKNMFSILYQFYNVLNEEHILKLKSKINFEEKI
jgi:hypothetical protein